MRSMDVSTMPGRRTFLASLAPFAAAPKVSIRRLITRKYTIGAHELSAQYGQYSRTGTETQKAWALGLLSTVNEHQILAAYRKSDDGGLTGTEQPSCDSWALAYKYLFDRNFDFMVLATKVRNKTGGLCDFGSNPVGAAATAGGGDPQGFGAGLRYVF